MPVFEPSDVPPLPDRVAAAKEGFAWASAGFDPGDAAFSTFDIDKRGGAMARALIEAAKPGQPLAGALASAAQLILRSVTELAFWQLPLAMEWANAGLDKAEEISGESRWDVKGDLAVALEDQAAFGIREKYDAMFKFDEKAFESNLDRQAAAAVLESFVLGSSAAHGPAKASMSL